MLPSWTMKCLFLSQCERLEMNAPVAEKGRSGYPSSAGCCTWVPDTSSTLLMWADQRNVQVKDQREERITSASYAHTM